MTHSTQRLNKNKGGYLGETIDIDEVIRDDLEAARALGWQIDELPLSSGLDLLAFRRMVKAPRRKLYLSTGIHGDEPAGPLAIRQQLQENRWPGAADSWLCPGLNHTGLRLNRRANKDSVEL